MESKKYQFLRPGMDTGDLLLFHGEGAIPWAIRVFSRGDVNHAAYVLRIREFLGDRVLQIGAVGKGFIPTPLSDYLAHYHGKAYWLPLNPEYHRLRRQIGREALNLSGVAYDYGSLFRNALGYVSTDAARLFCSEAVQVVGARAGLPLPPEWDHVAARPCDLESFWWWGERHKIS